MKKGLLVSIVLLCALVCRADLAVDFYNSTVGVQNAPENTFVPDGSLVQLIWSEAGVQTQQPGAYNVSGGQLLAGEYLLMQTITKMGVGFWGPIVDVYKAQDVGGADIHTGFFFTRVFGSVDANFVDGFVDVNPVNAQAWVYNPLDTSSVYSENATGLSGGSILYIPKQIPEPSTVGLMGIFGVSIFYARRRGRC